MHIREISSSKGELLAIFLLGTVDQTGTHFFTKPEQPIQVGFIKRNKGESIPFHSHIPTERRAIHTTEVLLVKSGRIMVYIQSGEDRVDYQEIKEGDGIILLGGGHGFEILEDCEIWEIKQGPYMGDRDKVIHKSRSVEPYYPGYEEIA